MVNSGGALFGFKFNVCDSLDQKCRVQTLATTERICAHIVFNKLQEYCEQLQNECYKKQTNKKPP